MISEQDILDVVPAILAELVGEPVRELKKSAEIDMVLKAGSNLFVVEVKRSLRSEVAAQTVSWIKVKAQSRGGVPLIAVPFMGEYGKGLCEKESVSYVDLSGNAWIVAPGLRIHVSGKPNKIKPRGRPVSLFSPKSSRLIRLLLLDPNRWWRQTDLAKSSNLGPGYVSRLCKQMEQSEIVVRNDNGALRPKQPDQLLDAWYNEYDFDMHDIRKGHVSVRSGEELVSKVAQVCGKLDWHYAFTGLSGAWLYAPFAAYRLVTVYLEKLPSDDLLTELGWYDEQQGANLWLLRPRDEGVFHGSELIKHIPCASAVQCYLDLKNLPERSAEAAEHLRKETLSW